MTVGGGHRRDDLHQLHDRAGLKKCMPMTSCGRWVTRAIEMIGRLGRRREDRPGLQISSRFSKSVVLIARSSAMASTTRSTFRGRRRRGPLHPGQHVGLGLLGGPAALDLLVEVPGDRGEHARDLVLAAADEQHVVPRLGEDLDDAARHRAGADDADQLDVVAHPRLSSALGVSASSTTTGCRGLVGVEAATGLAAEQAGDVLLEERRGRVQAVAALLVHRVQDLVRRVETDQVEQREQAHQVAAAEAHGRVDVLAEA